MAAMIYGSPYDANRADDQATGFDATGHREEVERAVDEFNRFLGGRDFEARLEWHRGGDFTITVLWHDERVAIVYDDLDKFETAWERAESGWYERFHASEAA